MGRRVLKPGQKYGRLTLLSKAQKNGRSGYWLCKCECGNKKIIRSDSIGRRTVSCGCYGKKVLEEQHKRKLATKYEDFDSKAYSPYYRLYHTWGHMKSRCYNANNNVYYLYGGRGIKVCDEWRDNYQCFKKWALANGWDLHAKGMEQSIDRIDPNKDYEPDNCRWVNAQTQALNKRNNFFITINGESRSITEWSRLKNIDPGVIRRRYYKYGLRGEDLFNLIPREMKYANNNKILFKGEMVPVVDLCRQYGISDATLRKRYERGWRDDELIKRPEHMPLIKMEYKGKMYSIPELCNNFGFKETTLRRRYSKGLDVYGNKKSNNSDKQLENERVKATKKEEGM